MIIIAFGGGIVLALVVLSLVASWLFFLLGTPESGKLDMRYMGLILSNMSAAIISLAQLPLDIVRQILTRLAVRRVWALAMLALWYFVGYESAAMLKFMDELYGAFYRYFWSSFLADALHVANIVYSTLVPVANSLTVLTQNLAYMAIDTVYNCQADTWKAAEGVLGLPPVFVGRLGAAFDAFAGNSTKASNPLVNVFNTTHAYAAVQDSVAGFVTLANCSCGPYTDVWTQLHAEALDPIYATAMSNVTYFPVCVLQRLLRGAAPLSPCTQALSVGAFGFGYLMDGIARVTMSLFNAESRVPRHAFIGAAVARFVQAGLAFLGTGLDVSARLLHLSLDESALYAREPFAQLYAAANSTGVSVGWIVQLMSGNPASADYAPQCELTTGALGGVVNLQTSAQCHAHANLRQAGVDRCGEATTAGIYMCFEGCVHAHPHLRSSVCVPEATCCLKVGSLCRVRPHQGRCQCNGVGYLSVHNNTCIASPETGCDNDDEARPCGWAHATETPAVCVGTNADPSTSSLDYGTPFACAAASLVRAPIALAHAAWRLGFLIFFRVERLRDELHHISHAWQAVDGFWRSRATTVFHTCDMRKQLGFDANSTAATSDEVFDFSAWSGNFHCDLHAPSPLLCTSDDACTYDPVGAAPTLQLVYAELDKLAYHLGAGLALPRSVGLLLTVVGQYAVELARVSSRALGLVKPAAEHLFSGPPFTQQINSKWGLVFTGPAPADRRSELQDQSQKAYDSAVVRNYTHPDGVVSTQMRTDAYNTFKNPQTCMFQAVYKIDQDVYFGYDSVNVDDVNGARQLKEVYVASARFCNSMMLEWLFFRHAELGVALSNTFSLLEGPIGDLGSLDADIDRNACHNGANTFTIVDKATVNLIFPCAPSSTQCASTAFSDADATWCRVQGQLRMPCSLASLSQETAVLGVRIGRQLATNVFAVLGAKVAIQNIDVRAYGQRCQLDQVMGMVSSTGALVITGGGDLVPDAVQKAIATALYALIEFFMAMQPFTTAGVQTFAVTVAQRFGIGHLLQLRSMVYGTLLQEFVDEILDRASSERDARDFVAHAIAEEIRLRALNVWQMCEALGQVLRDMNCGSCNVGAKALAQVSTAAMAVIGSVSDDIATAIVGVVQTTFDVIAVFTGQPGALKTLLKHAGSVVDAFVHNFSLDNFLGLALVYLRLFGGSKSFGGALYKMVSTGCNAIASFMKWSMATMKEQQELDQAEADVAYTQEADVLENEAEATEATEEISTWQSVKTKIVAGLKSMMPPPGKLACLVGSAAVGYKELGLRRLAETSDVSMSDADTMRLFDWRGDSECALHWRFVTQNPEANVTVDAKLLWCMHNRLKAGVLSKVVPSVPAAIFDDWVQPLRFAARSALSWWVMRTEGLHALSGRNLSAPMALWLDKRLPIRAMEQYGRRAVAMNDQWRERYRAALVPRSSPYAAGAGGGHGGVALRVRAVRRRLAAASTLTLTSSADARLDCTQPYCMKCLMLGETIRTVRELSVLNRDFYTKQYEARIRPEFLSYWSLDAAARRSYMITNAGVKWQASAPSLDRTEQWLTAWTHASLREVEDAVRLFFTAAPNATVPLMGHSLWHYVEALLQPCDANALFKGSRGTAHAFSAMITGVAAYYVVHLLVPWVPLPTFIGGGVGAYAYLNSAYGWQVRCLPALPAPLVDDLMTFVYGRSLPPCFCTLVGNTPNCNSDCKAGVPSANYKACPRHAFYYNFLFAVRWVWPELFLHFRKYYGSDDDVEQLVQQAVQHRSVTGQDAACFFATLPSFLLVVGGLMTVLSCIPSILQRVLVAGYHIFFAIVWLVLGITEALIGSAQILRAPPTDNVQAGGVTQGFLGATRKLKLKLT